MNQRLGRILWAIYLFILAWSVPLLALDLVPPGGELMATVMLVLPGGMCGWWLIERRHPKGTQDTRRTGALAAAVILVGSWAAEHLGVTTGWPFGRYVYTGVLQPTIGGLVPLAIPFAWLLVVPGALEMARLLIGDTRPMIQTVAAAALALLFDMVIEPAAVSINGYWTWLERGPLFGVPTANFVAWFGLALLLAGQTLLIIWAPVPRVAGASLSLPAVLYLLNLGLFTLVDLSHGALGAGLLGAAVLAGCAGRLRRRQVGWQLRFDALR